MQPKPKTNVVVIDRNLHRRLKSYCDKRGMKIGAVATRFIANQLEVAND
jgi:hypothetical protein